MPSLETSRKIAKIQNNGAKTIGQVHKEMSDFIMEETWNNDIQSRVCYIYDYWHDDQPELRKHMTYDNTTKTRIDAKFIVSSYGSMDKDQVAYHLLFKPSQKKYFDEKDDLYYYETDYRNRYDMVFPIGLFIDIPDDEGIYNRWLICDIERGNQFIKYFILPCDYRFQWISVEGDKRIKRQMWGCTRNMNSYTSGLWIDRYIYSLDNVTKALLPLNSITETIHYVREDGDNQRIIVSAKTEHPTAHKISKLENTKPIGLIKVTMKQDVFDQNTDYVERDSNGKIIGMWANYYDYKVEPIPPEIPEEKSSIYCKLKLSSPVIKDGGSYKTISAFYYNPENEDISNNYSSIPHLWEYSIDGENASEFVTEKEQEDKNIIKIKLNTPDKRYLNKLLTIKCTVNDISENIDIEIGI